MDETMRDVAGVLPEEAAAFDSVVLANWLSDLMANDPRVRPRVEALKLSSNPDILFDVLNKRMDRVMADDRELNHRDLYPLSRDLRSLLSDIRILLLPVKPLAAFELVDRFLDLDELISRSEEGGGPLMDVFSDAARFWLDCAAATRREGEDWASRLWSRFVKDRFGARNDLLRCAGQLVSDDDLRTLADRILTSLEESGEGDGFDLSRYRSASGLRALSRALKDADLFARTTLMLHPDPNPRQVSDIVDACLEFDGPEAALQWLSGDWGEREVERLALLDRVHEASGNRVALKKIRKARFDAHPTAEVLSLYLQVAGREEEARILQTVPRMARESASLYSGVNLLLSVDMVDDAERLVLGRMQELKDYDYTALQRLVEKFTTVRARLALVACYRVLLDDILEGNQFRAYGPGAGYLQELRTLHDEIPSYGILPPHGAYEKRLRDLYGRQSRFWERVEA